MTAIKLIFTKFMLAQQLFAKSYTKYHENLTYNLANNTKSQIDVVSLQGILLAYFTKKHLKRKHYKKTKAKVSQQKYDIIPALFPVLSAAVCFLSPESLLCLKSLMSVLEGH